MRELLARDLRGEVREVTNDDFANKLLAAPYRAVRVGDNLGGQPRMPRGLGRLQLADQVVAIGDECLRLLQQSATDDDLVHRMSLDGEPPPKVAGSEGAVGRFEIGGNVGQPVR